MSHLILLRHGQSLWNAANRFTGWVDVPLSQQGIEEAQQAGRSLATYPIQAVVMSDLQRAQHTAMIALTHQQGSRVPVRIQNHATESDKYAIASEEASSQIIPCYVDSRMNERHYGDLQGFDKEETRKRYGEEQVHIWRRSFDVPPPGGESLEMTAARVLPCLEDTIKPLLEQNECVLVAAHGNSLRSMVMAIEGLSKESVLALELPTGIPRHYRYEKNGHWHHVA